jgi:hypothetical protein
VGRTNKITRAAKISANLFIDTSPSLVIERSLIGHRMIRTRREKGCYRLSTQHPRKGKRHSIRLSAK